ncbi:GH92 family glycosyl hydrolase [Nocardia sp. NPDC051570]|uniref:GH92 family glycosyl hydrolase n=1 Tax=Nocardia sp. NPDC051570 TaxID=3364324 RepID=UPI0037B03C9E
MAQRDRTAVRRFRRVAAVVGAVSVLTAGPLVPAVSAAPDGGQDLARWVEPRVGTQPGDQDMGTGGGAGNTFPGADVPFGMVQWSPDTVTAQHGGYFYDDNRIKGFSLTHLSGAGCDTYQDFPFMPTIGDVTDSPASLPQKYVSTFSHADEQAEPGSYRVALSDGVRVELGATQRTGTGRFSYPPGAPATLLVNVAGSVMGTEDAHVTIGPDYIEGSARSGRFCGTRSSYTVYFHARFDRPFQRFGTWHDDVVTANRTAESGSAPANPVLDAAEALVPQSLSMRPIDAVAPAPGVGAYVGFEAGASVTMQVGLSFVSIDGARANLAAEGGTPDIDRVRTDARAAWNARLNQIRVTGGTDDQRRTFYTALYHALLQPNIFSDVDGRYAGFDKAMHTTDPRHPIYTNFSGWDIYRSEVQLLALLAPREAADIARSMTVFAREGGAWDRWTVANDYTGVMNGDPYHIIVSSIYAFGATDFDATQALSQMAVGASTPGVNGQGYEERPGLIDYRLRGYVPGQASDTLEYTSADFAIAQLADRLRDIPMREEFLTRARNWHTLFDPGTGYLRPRDVNGAFAPTFDPASPDGYVEGNGAQYTWMVPYDLRGLIDALGGDDAVNTRLDTFFTKLNVGTKEPYAFLGNEPTLQTPWIYTYTGAPAKTQALVDRARGQLFRAGPNGLVGNDDLGEMSSWYVWAALGMYPMIPGRAELVLNSPLFTSATITRPGGRTITVDAPNAGPGRPYVTALAVNGQSWTKPWLPESFVTNGGTLDYTLSGTADPAWGSAAADAPPSFR